MKPFNLDECIAGKPVITKDGRPVNIAGYNPDAINGARLTGWIDNLVRSWSDNGTYCDHNANVGGHPQCDLFMAPTKRTVWVNLYPPFGGMKKPQAIVHYSEEEADNGHSTVDSHRLGNKAHPIEIEE